jgi:hypothetical protein
MKTFARPALTFVGACLLANVALGQSQAPPEDPSKFYGSFAIELPETVGQAKPTVKWTLRCREGQCALASGNEPAQVFDKLEAARSEHFAQAQFALKYAKEHKAEGKKAAPYLSALLDSDSELQSCIDLGYRKPSFPGADVPGMTLLCGLRSNPWPRPAVLLLGTLLANCGPAFCRYEIVPLFKE